MTQASSDPWPAWARDLSRALFEKYAVDGVLDRDRAKLALAEFEAECARRAGQVH